VAIPIALFGFVQPVLHVHAGLRTFEDQIGHMAAIVTSAGSCVLIPVNVGGRAQGWGRFVPAVTRSP
jgi:hypothetical protein